MNLPLFEPSAHRSVWEISQQRSPTFYPIEWLIQSVCKLPCSQRIIHRKLWNAGVNSLFPKISALPSWLISKITPSKAQFSDGLLNGKQETIHTGLLTRASPKTLVVRKGHLGVKVQDEKANSVNAWTRARPQHSSCKGNLSAENNSLFTGLSSSSFAFASFSLLF